MSRPKIYLAGPIAGRNYAKATEWRDRVAAELTPAFECLSPMRNKEQLKAVGTISGTYEGLLLGRADAILLRDQADLDRCDAALVYLPDGTHSVGTFLEMGYLWAKGTPMVVVTTDATLQDHPFMRRLSRLVVVRNFEDAFSLLYSLFNL